MYPNLRRFFRDQSSGFSLRAAIAAVILLACIIVGSNLRGEPALDDEQRQQIPGMGRQETH
jgi:hypothetical protein